MPQPPKVSKHGTLDERDLEDVQEIDIDHVLQHKYSASTTHIFGKIGGLPPAAALAVERRYTKFWSILGENGTEYVGLTKSNSAAKGKFKEMLPEGQYRLVVKLVKSQNVLEYATAPIGTFIGGMSSLVVPAEKREEAYGRGMPTEYVDVNVTVSTSNYVIMEHKVELDQRIDMFTRVFVVKQADANSNAEFKMTCNSNSIVKKMKVQADLLRCDLPRVRAVSTSREAAQGKELLKRVLSSGSEPKAAAAKPTPPPPPPKGKGKRFVLLNESVPVSDVLVRFYSVHAPEKVSQVPKIMEHFLTRDKHFGVLFATLEDKYRVVFDANGNWKYQK